MLRSFVDVVIIIHDIEHRDMDNDKVYRLRKNLSDVMKDHGFGEPEERDGKFLFFGAHPLEDEYYTPENVLVMSFRFDVLDEPRQVPQDARFITRGIPRYIDHVRENFEDICASAHFAYLS